MKALVFCNGPPRHGIVRFTRMLSAAMAAAAPDGVVRLETPDPAPGPADMRALRVAAVGTDVALFHYSPFTNYLWGPRQDRADSLVAAMRAVGVPAVVMIHDVYAERPLQRLRAALSRAALAARRGAGLRAAAVELLRAALAWRPRSETAQLRQVCRAAAHVMVGNEIERDRLARAGFGGAVSIQPHFIERRTLIDRAEAKHRLGLSQVRVVTVLGFIFRQKGHDVAVRALAHLPDDVRLIFAGGGRADDHHAYEADVRATIDALGLRARVLTTGWLDEETLDLWLSATDVALAPFAEVSASGSLSTWLASRAPIVATDLPLLRQYAREFGPSVRLVAPRTPEAFADAVVEAFETPPETLAARCAIAERYAPERCAEIALKTLDAAARAGLRAQLRSKSSSRRKMRPAPR